MVHKSHKWRWIGYGAGAGGPFGWFLARWTRRRSEPRDQPRLWLIGDRSRYQLPVVYRGVDDVGVRQWEAPLSSQLLDFVSLGVLEVHLSHLPARAEVSLVASDPEVPRG